MNLPAATLASTARNTAAHEEPPYSPGLSAPSCANCAATMTAVDCEQHPLVRRRSSSGAGWPGVARPRASRAAPSAPPCRAPRRPLSTIPLRFREAASGLPAPKIARVGAGAQFDDASPPRRS